MPETSTLPRPDAATKKAETPDKQAEATGFRAKIAEKGRNSLTRIKALGEKLDPRRPARQRAAAVQEKLTETHLQWINAQIQAEADGNKDWARRLTTEYTYGDPTSIAKEHPETTMAETSEVSESPTAAIDTFGSRLHDKASKVATGAMYAGMTLSGVVLDAASTYLSGNSSDNPWVLAMGGVMSAVGIYAGIAHRSAVREANSA